MTSEDAKGCFHVAAMMLAATMGSYNLLRYAETRNRRNAFNAMLYLGEAVYEAKQTHRHWSKRG